ncbi:MAG: carboxypeptidase-like regulatory domain-containing protein, partial [Acidobacteriota bacterium]|nr:carboxypeptidase-like regulatory domain-containing protein [Acidobacteriota bacterium]
ELIYRVFKKVGMATATDQCPSGPCVNVATNTATATGQTSFSLWGVGSLAPNAAATTVSGRVLTAAGRGVPRALVFAIDQNGVVRSARSNQFGYYRFWEIPVGLTYTFIVESKGYTFAPRVVSIVDEIDNLVLTASP